MDGTQRQVVLVSCTSKKREGNLPAFLTYSASPWFCAMWQYAIKLATDPNKDIYILSALHGLLDPLEPIEPYDERLSRRKVERESWASMVLKGITDRYSADETIRFWFLAGELYRNPLAMWVSCGKNWSVVEPFSNVPGIQRQIEAANERRAILERIDAFLDTLPMTYRWHG